MQTEGGRTGRRRHYTEGIRVRSHCEAVPQAPSVMPIAYVK
jgi:hypothetical protein